MNSAEWKKFSKRFEDAKFQFQRFAETVEGNFRDNPELLTGGHSAVHSTRMRIKDPIHLKEKIIRKRLSANDIIPDTLTSTITDLAGVRILLLYQSDFRLIDDLIRRRINAGDWVLGERGKAMTWDPENEEFFNQFDLDVEHRATDYTSVHYLIKPRADVDICCELQVRTLFEEIWGEVDHRLNYPVQSSNIACREQLRVLSKIVGAGSRLLESIQRTSKK